MQLLPRWLLSMNPPQLHEAAKGNHKDVISAFAWDSTDEGFNYWNKVDDHGHTEESLNKIKQMSYMAKPIKTNTYDLNKMKRKKIIHLIPMTPYMFEKGHCYCLDTAIPVEKTQSYFISALTVLTEINEPSKTIPVKLPLLEPINGQTVIATPEGLFVNGKLTEE